MLDKISMAKVLAKAAISKLPKDSKAHEIFSKLEPLKPEDLGMAAKEILVVAAGKGRSIVGELAQKAADALSSEALPTSPKPVFSGKVHELTVWNDSHEVSIEDEVIVVTSTDGREQTRINLRLPAGRFVISNMPSTPASTTS